MSKLEMLFIGAMFIAAIVSFLQTHWFAALLITALFGLLLWLLYALLSNINLVLIPLLFWW